MAKFGQCLKTDNGHFFRHFTRRNSHVILLEHLERILDIAIEFSVDYYCRQFNVTISETRYSGLC